MYGKYKAALLDGLTQIIEIIKVYVVQVRQCWQSRLNVFGYYDTLILSIKSHLITRKS